MRLLRAAVLSLANTAWYIEQFRRRDPTFPVMGTPDERRAANASIWNDSSLVVPVSAPPESDLRSGVARIDSVEFTPRPAYGDQVLAADEVFLDVVRAAGFITPVTVSMTAGTSGLAWLQPFAREDGMHWRLVPVRNPPRNPLLLRANLVGGKEYRGYGDSSVVIDGVTRTMGFLYLGAFKTLLEAETASGNAAACREIEARVRALLPLLRLATVDASPPTIEHICRR